MFDPIFMNNLQQGPNDNPWLIELINCNYKTYLLHQVEYMLGMNIVEQYSLVEASHNKWIENGNDLDNNEYELPILKYDANQDKMVEHKGETLEEDKEGTIMEKEKEPKTPWQMTSKEGEQSKSSNKECCKSNNGFSVESQHQEECRATSYVRHYKYTYK